MADKRQHKQLVCARAYHILNSYADMGCMRKEENPGWTDADEKRAWEAWEELLDELARRGGP